MKKSVSVHPSMHAKEGTLAVETCVCDALPWCSGILHMNTPEGYGLMPDAGAHPNALTVTHVACMLTSHSGLCRALSRSLRSDVGVHPTALSVPDDLVLLSSRFAGGGSGNLRFFFAGVGACKNQN